MLDGAALVAAVAETGPDQGAEADSGEQAGDQDQATQAGENGAPSDDNESAANSDSESGRTVVIIDAAVEDTDALLGAVDPAAEIFYLEAGIDGIHQISSILLELSDVTSLHILSHGTTGAITIGSTTLDATNLASFAAEFVVWDAALAEGADILVYGCNVASDGSGQDFIDLFSDLTGADIAASDDLTGHESLGGDWDLEVSAGGPIESESIQATEFSGVLVTFNQAPLVTGPGSTLETDEQTPLNLHGVGFGVTAVDEGQSVVEATLSVGEGVLNVVTDNTGPTISGNGTGIVTLSGTVDQINALLDGQNGTIVYYNGSDTPSASTVFTVVVNDLGATGVDPGLTGDDSSEEGSASQTIIINPVNDRPVLTGLDNSPTYTEGGSPVPLDNSVTVFDAEENWNGGQLTIGGLDPADIVSPASNGGASVVGNQIFFGGVAVATFTGGNGSDLVITFNSSTTNAAVESVIESLVFSNTSGTPTATRTFSLTLTDGSGDQALGPTVFTRHLGRDNPLGGGRSDGVSTPNFVDIDGDGDYEPVIGSANGFVYIFVNDGTPENPDFIELPNDRLFPGITPTHVDLDNDGDYDAVFGMANGRLATFINVGTPNLPIFNWVCGPCDPLANVQVGRHSAPVFVDIDNDGDQDLFIGRADGEVAFFENVGNAASPDFQRRTGADNPLDGVDVGEKATPAFADIDGDGDQDVVIGSREGTLHFFRNDGDANTPNFVRAATVDDPFAGLETRRTSAPALVDIDNDGDVDAFVGWRNGRVHFFEASTGFEIVANVVGTDPSTPDETTDPTGTTDDDDLASTGTDGRIPAADPSEAQSGDGVDGLFDGPLASPGVDGSRGFFEILDPLSPSSADPLITGGIGRTELAGANQNPEDFLPGTIDLAASSDTGFLDDDDITRDTTPLLTGLAPANTIVRITNDGQVIGTAQADQNGNWSFTSPNLGDGRHQFVAVPLNGEGEEGTPSVPLVIVVDTQAPEAPSIPYLSGQNGTPRTGEEMILEGTAEPGAKIVLTSDRDGVIGEAVADENGDWQIVATPRSESLHRLTATATDAAGNTSPQSTPLEVQVLPQRDNAALPGDILLAGLDPAIQDQGDGSTGAPSQAAGAGNGETGGAQGFIRQVQVAGRPQPAFALS